jgi:hypothetical protein
MHVEVDIQVVIYIYHKYFKAMVFWLDCLVEVEIDDMARLARTTNLELPSSPSSESLHNVPEYLRSSASNVLQEESKIYQLTCIASSISPSRLKGD